MFVWPFVWLVPPHLKQIQTKTHCGIRGKQKKQGKGKEWKTNFANLWSCARSLAALYIVYTKIHDCLVKNENFSNAANHTLSIVHNFGSCTVLQPQIPLALDHPSQAEFCDLDFTTDQIIPSQFHLRSLAYQPIDSDTKEWNTNKSPAWKQKSEACMALIWCFHSLTVGASLTISLSQKIDDERMGKQYGKTQICSQTVNWLWLKICRTWQDVLVHKSIFNMQAVIHVLSRTSVFTVEQFVKTLVKFSQFANSRLSSVKQTNGK